jgi:hypothetical protein
MFQEEQDGSYLGNAAWAAVHMASDKIAAVVLHATLSDARAETLITGCPM